MQDSLERLLYEADQAATPPPLVGNLAGRVRTRLRRKRRVLAAASAMTLVLLCAAVLLHQTPPHQTQQAKLRPEDVARLRAEIVSASVEADVHQRTARLIAQQDARIERLRLAQRALDIPDPLDRVAEARDRAALILVRSADRMGSEPQDRAQAVEAYRQAVQRFPETPAGQLAAQRLKNFGV